MTKNWLLAMAGISLCLALSFNFLIGDILPYKGKRNFSDIPIGISLIMILIWAPIVEEIIFRGFFVKKQWIRIIAFVGLPLFVLFNLTNYVTLLILVMFLIVYFAMKIDENENHQNLAIFLNILLFSILHYDFDELISSKYFYLPFYQIFAGCLLMWITINFNIFKSMLFHFSWNSLIVAILLYSIQFPNKEVKIYKDEFVHVEWSQSPKFNAKKSTIKWEEDYLEAKNIEAKTLYKLLSDTLDQNARILQPEPYMKYNFIITPGKKNLKNRSLGKSAKKFLKDNNLIYTIKE